MAKSDITITKKLLAGFLFGSSPLADLAHPQDVGEEGFVVPDDQRLPQLSVLQEVFGQNVQGSQVGGLRGQDFEHALSERERFSDKDRKRLTNAESSAG